MRARRALLLHLAAAGVSLALALAFGWQGVAHPVTRIWGDLGDAWQNWWNGWWMGFALSHGHSPFFTHLLWHPDGVPLWLQTFGPLNALLTAVGQWLLPGFAGYNLLVLFHLAFGCYGGFVLAFGILERARATGRLPERLPGAARFGAAMAGGATFGLSPYVWAHISTHLHLTSIGFVALFVHAVLESRARPGWRWPLAAGLFALGTALCGWYLIVDEAIVAGVVVAAALVAWRRDGGRPVGRLALAGAFSAVLCLPLVVPTLLALHQPLTGGHPASVFSADLWSFFVPTPMMALGAHFRGITSHFTGNAGENGGYLGYAALLLSGIGLVALRGRRLVALAIAGLAGLILSLGPWLHVGGGVHRSVPLPYAWLAKVLPVLNGLGCPVRFELPMNLFLAAGVAAGIAWIAGRLMRRAAPAWVLALAVVLPGAAVAGEYAPFGQSTARLPAPAWLEALAKDPRPWAMADLTGWSEPLWHQTLHHHPILHGYISRRPKRLVDKLMGDPVLGGLYDQALWGGRDLPVRVALRRVDPRLDFRWGAGSPGPGVAPDFAVMWNGTLTVPAAGPWRFVLGSDDGAVLWLDGHRVVATPGRHPYLEREATVGLGAGPHRIRVYYRDLGGLAALTLRWAGPHTPLAVVPASALATPGGAPGLEAVYRDRAPHTKLAPAAARAWLRDHWGVRYLLTRTAQTPWLVSHDLGLVPVHRGGGLTLWEVRLRGAGPRRTSSPSAGAGSPGAAATGASAGSPASPRGGGSPARP